MKTTFYSFILLLALMSTGCGSKDNGTQTVPTCTWTPIFAEDFHRSDSVIGSNFHVIIQPTPSWGHGFVDIFNNSLRISSDSVYWAIVYANDVDGSKTRVSVECTTPPSGGTCAFGVGGKFTNAGTMGQSGYFAAAMNNTLGIYKAGGGGMTTIATQNFQPQFNHTYKIVFTIDNGYLSATITDEASGAAVTVNATDSGIVLSGKQYSINGNSLGGQVVLIFNNLLVESCQ